MRAKPAKPSRRARPAAAAAPAKPNLKRDEKAEAAAPLARAEAQPKPEPKAEAKPAKVELPKIPNTLDSEAPVVDAPSIGPKTARRLEALGVHTIADLLRLSPDDGEHQLATRHISAQVIRDWQSQARLACTVPGLRSREAQALVACGVHDAGALTAFEPGQLCEAIARWGLSDEGSRAWGNAPAPTEEDVAGWIERARTAQAGAQPGKRAAAA